MPNLRSIIKSLLPIGALWSDDNPIMQDLVGQISSSLTPVLVKSGLVRKQFYPSSADQLDQWLADFNVVNRADLLKKFIQKGSQSKGFYLSVIRSITESQSIRISVLDSIPVGRIRAGQRLTTEYRSVTFIIEGVPAEKRAELTEILDKSVPPYMRFAIR